MDARGNQLDIGDRELFDVHVHYPRLAALAHTPDDNWRVPSGSLLRLRIRQCRLCWRDTFVDPYPVTLAMHLL